IMNTKALSREERKKAKREARKKREQTNPKKPRDYPRGSKKRKVKKMARGAAKRYLHPQRRAPVASQPAMEVFLKPGGWSLERTFVTATLSRAAAANAGAPPALRAQVH